MSQNLTNMFNLALSVVGGSPTITDPDANNSSANILRLWYPVARRAVFTAGYWNSLRTQKLLARANERDMNVPFADGDPVPGFRYSYAFPVDALHPQYMEDFSPFELGRVGQERLIFSNSSRPILRYTVDVEEPATWESELYRCVAWALGACVNMQKNGKMALTQKLEQQVKETINQAAAISGNSEDQYFDAAPSFYVGTGFSPPIVQPSRFYYPTTSFTVEGIMP